MQRRFDEIKEENNENQIADNLRSDAVSRKSLEVGYSFVGRDATLKYYNEYKTLDKKLMRKDLQIKSGED